MRRKIGDLQQGDAERIVARAIEAGINFIDTADVYGRGAWQAPKPMRQDIVTGCFSSRHFTTHAAGQAACCGRVSRWDATIAMYPRRFRGIRSHRNLPLLVESARANSGAYGFAVSIRFLPFCLAA